MMHLRTRLSLLPPALTHATLVVAGYAAVFAWVFSQLLVAEVYLAESDLHELFLPYFLSPMTRWSSDMFAGMPVFADPFDTALYPIHVLFARVLHSWAGYIISAYVLGSAFMYAYVLRITGSRTAAAFSGLAFGLSEAMIERQAHINLLHPFAWLPLVALSVDRLLTNGSARWVAVGAFAIANSFLGGHPQPLLYAGSFAVVYAAAGGIATRAPREFYLRAAAALALGLLLSAIKLLPFLEATTQAARDVVTYERFLTSSHTPMQMLGVVFPAIPYSGREAPLYVGLAVLALALVALMTGPLRWRAAVWLGGAIFALLVSAGEATPLARLAYALPLYDRFRVGARMLILFAAGAAVLAGMGVAALQRGEGRRVASWAAGALMLALVLPALFVGDIPGASGQLAIAVVTATGLALLGSGRGFNTVLALLAGVLVFDLLHTTPYLLTRAGLRGLNVIAIDDADPSVHAKRLAAALVDGHHRALAIDGVTRDAIVPGGFARLWRIPIAGGYTQILGRRLAALAGMGANGDIRPESLALENRTLDLLAVRYVIEETGAPAAGDPVIRAGIAWAAQPLDFPVGRPDCGHAYPRKVSLPLPDQGAVKAIALVAHLRCGDKIPQGTEVGSLDVIGDDGHTQRRSLVAGVDIADRELRDPATRALAGHRPAAAFDDPSLEPIQSLIRFDLTTPVSRGRLVLRTTGVEGWLSLERLTFIDADGTARPRNLRDLLLENAARWREVARFRTSRTSDRRTDERADGEREFVVYENLRVMPRAWVAPAIVELEDADAIPTIQHGQLPDGPLFDPAAMAIVPPGSPRASAPRGGVPASVRVVLVGEGRIEVEVTSAGGLLVLSENYYPGWRARVSDRDLPVTRANVTLQGVQVPGGTHRVVFEFSPLSLHVGTALSLVAATCVVMLFRRLPDRRHSSDNGRHARADCPADFEGRESSESRHAAQDPRPRGPARPGDA